jgi:hypothetical protein
MFEDYHAWLKVADTALPQNIIGYIVQLCLSPLRSKPFDTAPYDNPKEIAKCGEVGTKSFLSGKLPQRGDRPEILKWMAPNRQTSQLTGDDMHTVKEFPVEEENSLTKLLNSISLRQSRNSSKRIQHT